MNRKSILVVAAFVLSGCTKPATSTDNQIREPVKEEIDSSYSQVDFDFLTECDSLEMWQGGIQGVNLSDSTGPYIFGECHTNRHYDVIVFHRSEIPLDVGTDDEKKIILGNVYGAEYYSFEIPKKYPIEVIQEDNARFEYVFPCNVKINKRLNDKWYLIDTKPVKSFEELGQLKLSTIFKYSK